MMPAVIPLRTQSAPCPACRGPLDGGPVQYWCGACRRTVWAADLSTERQPAASALDAGAAAGACSCPCLCWRPGIQPGSPCGTCRSGRHGGDAVTARFPGVTGAAARARAFTRAALGAGHPAADTIDLCVTELVSDAVACTASGLPGGTVSVAVESAAEGGVTVTVRDDGARSVPHLVSDPAGLTEHGRGLCLVSALADDGAPPRIRPAGLSGSAAPRGNPRERGGAAGGGPGAQQLALLRAEHSQLLAAARAAVAAGRDGCPDPLALIRGVLAARGQLPPDGMGPQQLLAVCRPRASR